MAGTVGQGDMDRRSLAQQLMEDDDAILMDSGNEDVGGGVTKFLDEPDFPSQRIPAEQKVKNP